MSHLKLQKLLFYVQAYHLAYFDEPIIVDEFEAWAHGPVSRKVYNEVRDLSTIHREIRYQEDEKGDPIQRLEAVLSSDQIDLMNDVLNEYGQMSSYALENETHNEQPWIAVRRGFGPGERCSNIIEKPAMQDYYKKLLYGDGEAF